MPRILPTEPDHDVEAVIDLCGGAALMCRRLGINPANAHQWKVKGHIPPSQALNISLISRLNIDSLPIRWATMPDDSDPEVGGRDVSIAA